MKPIRRNMERKVNERFVFNGKTYSVIQGGTCEDCVFYDRLCGCMRNKEVVGECLGLKRKDHTPVIFKEIENPTTTRIKTVFSHKRKRYMEIAIICCIVFMFILSIVAVTEDEFGCSYIYRIGLVFGLFITLLFSVATMIYN